VNARRTIFGLITAFAVFALAAWQHAGHSPGNAGEAVAGPGLDTVSLHNVWLQPLEAPGYRSASMSGNGAFFATVTTEKNLISVRHQSGSLIWSRVTPDITNAIVSSDGKVVIAFAALDPTRPGIRIYQGDKGQTPTEFTLDGAIWDVEISADSKTATVVTGAHTLYLIHLDGKPECQKWTLSGAGNSVAISHDSQYIATGTWDECGVSVYDTTGKPVWSFVDTDNEGKPNTGRTNKDGKPILNRLFEAQIAGNGRYVLGISYGNVHHSDPTIYLWRLGTGVPLWPPKDLGPDTSDPKAMITANGQYIALTYLTSVSHGDETIQERRLSILDHYGNEVCSLPGFLFAPNLVAGCADGSCIVVSDGQRALYTVSPDGRMSLGKTMTAPIRQTIASEDGRFVLVYTSDGNLNLLRLE
jgi:WD40 repeat protein